MDAIRRALEIKLAALSQSMIARLIRNHDKEHRLEGFLKITQAAQTDALVRVLDENLARYLAQVLEERGKTNFNLRRSRAFSDAVGRNLFRHPLKRNNNLAIDEINFVLLRFAKISRTRRD